MFPTQFGTVERTIWHHRPVELNIDKHCHKNLNTHVNLELRFIFPFQRAGVWLSNNGMQ